MRSFRGPIAGWEVPEGRSTMVIGVFDGVHLGHRHLLDKKDPGLVSTVLTFDPHPVEVLRPGTPPRLITTVDERLALLEDAGVDAVGVLDLREIKEMLPASFVEDVLVDKFQIAQIVAGDDFRFGKDRAGDLALLREIGELNDFEVETVELVSDDHEVISSSRVRQLIEAGHVAEAARLTSSWFSVTNDVVEGDKRGRQLGFPTANLRPPHRKVVPGTGVYACHARVADQVLSAAVNVGVRPTFGGGELLIEAYLLDFDEEIYGLDLTLEFVERLRPEMKFEVVDELVAQMGLDVGQAAAILEDSNPNRS